MKKAKIISVLCAISILFVGCGSTATTSNSSNVTSNKTATTSSVDLSTVTITVGETGWKSKEAQFKAAGLDDTPYKVEYVNFQGGNLQLEAQAAKQLDLASTSEIPPIFASQSTNGGNFKVIAYSQANTLLQELVIPKGSKLKSVADLKGKKVAYVDSTTAHYFLLKMLQEAGLTWSDITPVELSTPDGATALIGGKVDALASYGNAIITAHLNGATTLASAKDILSGNFPIEASLSAISDPGKHAAIVDYLSRLNKATAWTRENSEEWATLVAAATKQPLAQALSTFKEAEAQTPTKISPTSKEAIASQQDIVDTFFKVGLLKSKVDVSSYWSNAFDDELNKALGQ